MKKILILLLSLVTIHCNAQNVSLDWVKTFGNTSTENAEIFKNDSEDNLYVIGRFDGTVDFDPGPGVVNKTSNGGLDIYILKLNSSGNFLWVRTIGNSTNDITEHARVDKLDNIVLTGRFVNSIDFDPTAGVDIKTANGFSDAYVLKLDGMGNYLWTKTIGGTGHTRSRGLSINSTNDITIAGAFLDTVDFDPGPGVVNKSALGVDIYVLQLNAAGNFNWVKTLKGNQTGSVQVNDIMFDQNDNLLMNAAYKDSIDVDPGPGTQYLVDTADPLQYNLFMLKLDPNGNYLWAKQFQNTVGNSVGVSVLSHDSIGNYYLGGFFFGTVDFDFGTATNIISTPKSASYILKVDSNGNFIWAKHMGGFSGNSPEYETVFDIAIDVQGNVNLCGTFKGYEDFDPGPNVYYLGSPNNLNYIHGYIMQLDNAGNLNYAKNIGGLPSAATVNGIVLNHQGNLYVAGDFYDNTDFDFNTGVTNVMAQGGWDAFVLKIKNCSNSVATDVINSCTPITWINGLTYSSTNFTATHVMGNSEGCDSAVTLNLTIIPPIDTTVNNTSSTLSSNATGVSYQWVDCGNNFAQLAGETNQSFSPNTSGSYAVVLNNGSCTDTSRCHSYIALATSAISMSELSVYPNPTNNLLHVKTNGQAMIFRLYNSLGQLVLVRELVTKEVHTINLGKLSKGMYMYSISNKLQGVSRAKLMLE